MQYMGSKRKIAHKLLPIILKGRKKGQYYVEPFAGGCNMIDKVRGNRIANDSHFYLIEMWKAIQNGWRPPCDIDQVQYTHIRLNQSAYPPPVVGFVGFLCSFGGKWFGGFAANSKGDNYAHRGSIVLQRQIQLLRSVQFVHGQYYDLDLPAQSIVYCDPPYANSTQYANDFNHSFFWWWVRKTSKRGHKVFVSEYSAPKDFIAVKKIWHKTILDRNDNNLRAEKLFVYNG